MKKALAPHGAGAAPRLCMHVVVIHGWKTETAELAQALAGALGLTVYEARQRMIGGGPAVVASFADPDQARAVAAKLDQGGLATLVVDTAALRGEVGHFIVRRFVLGERALSIVSGEGQTAEIPYREIGLILPGTSITGQSETVKVTERKLSLGKTLLSGGIPMTTKVERQEQVHTEESEKVIYLYAGSRPQVVFRQNVMTYDGLGAAMKMSREVNFAFLTSELHRLCPGALYDDRLLSRGGQSRMLGPAQNPERNLDLAAEILARSLQAERDQ
jgi:hypothetical protein